MKCYLHILGKTLHTGPCLLLEVLKKFKCVAKGGVHVHHSTQKHKEAFSAVQQSARVVATETELVSAALLYSACMYTARGLKGK
jgi:hypothetical protein